MKLPLNVTLKTLVAGVVFCSLSSLVLAQPPAGKKQRGDRAEGSRGTRGGDSAELAAKMIKEHDKSGDGELQAKELATALAAQRQRGAGGAAAGQRPGRPAAGKGNAGQQRGGAKGGSKGQRNAGNGQRGGTRGRGMGQGGDPAQLVARMIQQFDKDGSKSLNASELAASIEARRAGRGDRGGAAKEGRPGKNGGAAGKGAGREGKRGKGARENSEPGTGVVPEKPQS